jgi:hypothetical protein
MTAQGAESLIFGQLHFESFLTEQRFDFENRDFAKLESRRVCRESGRAGSNKGLFETSLALAGWVVQWNTRR